MSNPNLDLAEVLYQRLDTLMDANVDALGVAAGPSLSTTVSDEVLEIGNAEVVRTQDKALHLTIRTIPEEGDSLAEYSHSHVLLSARKRVELATVGAGGREFRISDRTRVTGLLELMLRSLEDEVESDPAIKS